MSFRPPQIARRSLAVLGVCAALMFGGCPSWPAGRPLVPFRSEADSDAALPPTGNRPSLEALQSPAAEERLKALEAWSHAPPGPLPAEVLDLRSDPDARVRAAAIGVLARARPPRAVEYVTAALGDNELRVRLAAITALGELGGPEAQTALAGVLKNEGELLRAAAVSALAYLGAQPLVIDAAADRSWRVRLAVARALTRFPSPQGAALAHKLLDDPSAAVQQEVIKAVADWPIESAGPLLLEAMGRSGYTTRKTAAHELSTRWSPANDFPIDGPAERRAEILAGLKQRFRNEIGPTELAPVSDITSSGDTSGERAVPVASSGQGLPEREAVLGALDRLAADDVMTRRKAAGDLADLARQQPLHAASVSRLPPLAARETDPLVWQELLAAVRADGSEAAARLAYAALGHASPEVRRRACEHLAAHPSARHVPMLLRALEDEHDQVAAAAARALGALGRLDDPLPLVRRLTSGNELLRVEVAVALTKLRDPAGPAALERLTYSTDPIVRRQVALALGELANPAFAPHLMRLLDDRPDVRRAALESLPKAVGYDVTARAGLPSPSPSEQVALWKAWFERQQSTVAIPQASPTPSNRVR